MSDVSFATLTMLHGWDRCRRGEWCPESRMLRVYEVKGVNPANLQVLQLNLLADSAEDARRHAEGCGLEKVVVGVVTLVAERRREVREPRRRAEAA